MENLEPEAIDKNMEEQTSSTQSEVADFEIIETVEQDHITDSEEADNKENSPEASEEETPSESIDINPENANTTNCLALTIQEDHKLVAVKNVFLRSIRMSWKVVVSTITLALIKLFS